MQKYDYSLEFRPLIKKYRKILTSCFICMAFGGISGIYFDKIGLVIAIFFVFITLILALQLYKTNCPNCKRCVFFLKIPIVMVPGIPKNCRNCGVKLK